MRKLYIIIIAIAVVCFQTESKAQLIPNLGGQRAGLSALSFLKNDMNPRSIAMGGASVSISSDEFATYTNPAGVADAKSLTLSTSNYFIGAGVNNSFVSGILPVSSSSGIGISIDALSTGAMEVRTEFQPDGTGQKIYANNMAIGASYGLRLSDMFTMGVTLKYIYEQLAEYKNHTATFDLGFKYQTDWNDLAFAVMIQNFSGSSTLDGDYQSVEFNQDGVSLDAYTAPTVFRMGASMIPLKKDRHQILVSFELDHPNDNAENFRFGAEYSYMKIVQFRAGYMINVAGKKYPTFGFGLRHRVGGHPLQIGYSVVPTNYLGVQHLVGLGFSINKDLQSR